MTKRFRVDPWKASALALAAAVVLAIGLRATQSADAQPAPGPAASADEPPAAQAGTVLTKAKETLTKAPRDTAGHRDRALEQINKAISETKSLPSTKEGDGE